MSTVEEGFMTATDAVGFTRRDMTPVISTLQDWLSGLEQAFEDKRLGYQGLLPESLLVHKVDAINAGIAAGKQHWDTHWEALLPAQSLAQFFENKVMLLVFGKFNAGKSSLCNYLAERFAQHGRSVQYFYLDGGEIRQTDDCFREGATETTARLQGVCLGDRLVLLDTPGLHSATDENAALTQRFLDSADAVLWLTSSTSPGQVQELDELARELHRGKPLLPIVTRSDFIDEDEVDGEIVKCLCNKSAANRALQESDVTARATDKLVMLGVDIQQLKTPVSVSAYVARTNGNSQQALEEAGFTRLYLALQDIVAPALAYKERKPAEMLLHHLQEQVVGHLYATTVNALADLQHALQAEREVMALCQTRIAQLVWRDVVPEVPRLLEDHAAKQDVDAVRKATALLVADAFGKQVSTQLDGYVLAALPAIDIVLPAGIGYDTMASGSTNSEDDDVGYEKLYDALTQSVREVADDVSARTVAACDQTLQILADAVAAQQDIVASYERRLRDIRHALHTDDD